MLLLSRADVEELLDLDELVDVLAGTMVDLTEGSASMPARTAAQVPERDAILGVMPAYVPSLGALTTKLVTLFPHNRDRETHQAVILCFDPRNGTPLALMDGTYPTAARTAAGSALATRLLARSDSRTIAILGAGVQARSHAHAVSRVIGTERILVAGRHSQEAEALVSELAGRYGLPAEVAQSFEEAQSQADVVCACTHSPDPVVRRAWLRSGTHVNSVGYNTAGREVDETTVRDAVVVVEARASALAPPPAGPNDLLWPIRDGVITPDHIHAEVGELVAGGKPGRVADEQITLYKSVGVAVQDATAAALILEAATKTGAGSVAEL